MSAIVISKKVRTIIVYILFIVLIAFFGIYFWHFGITEEQRINRYVLRGEKYLTMEQYDKAIIVYRRY